MDAYVNLAHAISPLAAGLLLASVWQGILLTAVVALLLRTMPSLSPAGRTQVWTAVLLLVLFLPLLQLAIPGSHAASHAEVHVASTWSLLLLAGWIVAAAARFAGLAGSAVRLWRLAARAIPLAPPATLLPLLNGPRRATLCASAEVNRPSVAGFFRPRVLLPLGLFETLSPAELEHVVLHEMEHLRRYDDWIDLLQQFSLVLLPLNPALFWLDRRLCRERELACDDGVLAATHARKAYAACLVKLAEDSLVRKGLTLALSALGTRAHESELIGRVRRILAGSESRLATGHLRALTAALSVAAVAFTFLLARSPQWISFDADAPSVLAQATEPTQTIPAPTSGGMLQTSARLDAGTFRPVMTSAVFRVPFHKPASIALQHRKPQFRLATAKLTNQTAKQRPAAPVLVASASTPAMSPSVVPTDAVMESTTSPATLANTATPRVVVTEFQVSQHIIAAVPVRGGWLILQL